MRRAALIALLILLPVAVHAGPAAPTDADNAFAADSKKMMMDMKVKPTGDPDKDFAAAMIPHHQGAIDMAKTELVFGHDPEMRELAAKILRSQQDEIQEMRLWQQVH